jgi:AcrR family transcriptional regulator
MAARDVVVLDPLKRERRKQILDAAKHVFAEAGYHGASIHAIIERADIARGTFYLYFESKSAVFSSILDQAMADLRRHMHRIEVDNPKIPPQLQLRAQVIDALEYVVQDRPLAMLLLSAGHTPDAEAAERLDQFFGEIRDLLRRAFESGQEIKLLRKQLQPELLAAAMLGMIRGVVELIITQPDAPKVEQVVDELLTVALRGVLA